MLVNQIANDGRPRTAQRLCPLLQQHDLLAFHFQCDGFHAGKVFSSWQQVNTGIIVVLDNRILTKQYGQAFLDALPQCPMEVI